MAVLVSDPKRRRSGRSEQPRLSVVPGHDKAIREITLGEQLYRYLRDLIASGKVEQGTQLPTEKQLCENFRMSRPIVREALARLRMEGLIVSRRGSGSYVNVALHPRLRPAAPAERHGTAQDGRDSLMTDVLGFFELRRAIECDAAYYAALRHRPEQLATMAAAMADMEMGFQLKSLDHEAHFRFHLAIADATANRFFIDALLALRQYFEVSMNLFRNLWLLHPGEDVDPGTYDHARIFQAINDRQPKDAYNAMLLHIQEANRELFGNLADPSPGISKSEV